MVTPQDLLKILADGKYHSGADIGRLFGVSRAAIWKVIQKLEQNYSLTVFAVKGKGYRLPHPVELLDKKNIVDNLLKKTLKQMNEFEIFFDIDSTNHYLNVKSLEGAPSAYVVLAEQQTKGQGRRGRTWISPFACNLTLSILWRYQLGPAQLGCLSLFVAVAIVRALNKLGVKDVGVKWPNDIYWHNKKLAGILLEMRGEANGPSAVVIGIGLNMSLSEDKEITKNIDQPWIDIESIMGVKIERNYFTALVIDALFEVLNAVPDKQKELLKEWQSMDVLKGEEIEVHFADKVIQGKALGINPDGALRVLHQGKELVCHSGEVSIRRNK
ncbi:MAG: biotin--[acetyl-CoA-carboxylase] ligase [Gammaproteobacteria bacterium]|nr:biotin--[acetyl-CoA-carboxylase] ligase [Gammaproteobacteria bacterium]